MLGTSLFKDSKDKTHRVLSFQSEEVLNILLSGKDYTPDASIVRERRDYKEDIDQLGGVFPVWGYACPYGRNFISRDFLDGVLFETFRCEMSLAEEGLKRFVMLELEVDCASIFTGKTHNAYKYAVVFPGIKREQVRAVYRINYLSDDVPNAKRIVSYVDDPLFEENGIVPDALEGLGSLLDRYSLKVVEFRRGYGRTIIKHKPTGVEYSFMLKEHGTLLTLNSQNKEIDLDDFLEFTLKYMSKYGSTVLMVNDCSDGWVLSLAKGKGFLVKSLREFMDIVSGDG